MHVYPGYPGSELNGPAESTPIASVEVQGEGNWLWKIEAGAGADLVDFIVYGQVPPGYVQVLPETGPPQPLRSGEQYWVSCGSMAAESILVTDTGVRLLPDEELAQGYHCRGCPPDSSLFMAYHDASAVFVGRVTQYEVAKRNRATTKPQRRATFEVSHWFKGGNGVKVTVIDGEGNGASDCPVFLEEGVSYLVYAHRLADSQALTVDSCSHTKALGDGGGREADLLAEYQKSAGW